MPSNLVWPSAPGPRILTLVGNDLTIDARARKMASWLARAGFSVISIGVDKSGALPPSEVLHGALLSRVTPNPNPKVSPRVVRLSRPELTDALRYKAEVRRQRLQSARRTLSADVAWAAEHPARWTTQVGRLGTSIATLAGLSVENRARVERRVTKSARRIDRMIRFGPRKVSTMLSQALHQASTIGYRVLGRPSRPLLGRSSWRRDLPDLHRYEAAMGSLVDSLRPDLIHVHDIFHLGLAARVKTRAERGGHPIRVVYDAHEYIPGLPIDERQRNAYTDLENEYFDRADAVVTVSDGLADLLQERFGTRPLVVMNTPDIETAIEVTPLRTVAGVPNGSPLVVYLGGIAPHRGAETLIEAMTHLDTDTHLVFVSNSVTGYVANLMALSRDIGLTGRVHLAPYVPPEGVVDYIRSADVSAIPLSRDVMNYEIALPNKLFQSVHAGVPVVVSDNPEMERFVVKHGVGEVFASGDPIALAQALSTILVNPEHYTAALTHPELLEETSWGRQVENLVAVYRSVGVEAP